MLLIFHILSDVFAHVLFIFLMFGIGIYTSLKCDSKAIERVFSEDKG